jgi:hypothetical protein
VVVSVPFGAVVLVVAGDVELVVPLGPVVVVVAPAEGTEVVLGSDADDDAWGSSVATPPAGDAVDEVADVAEAIDVVVVEVGVVPLDPLATVPTWAPPDCDVGVPDVRAGAVCSDAIATGVDTGG